MISTEDFSGEKLSLGRYSFGVFITTGLGLTVAIADGIMKESCEKDIGAANQVFTLQETRWIVSFQCLVVSFTKFTRKPLTVSNICKSSGPGPS